MLGLDVRKRSRVFALSLARSGTRVGAEMTCVTGTSNLSLYKRNKRRSFCHFSWHRFIDQLLPEERRSRK